MYLSVRGKCFIALFIALLWFLISSYLSLSWIGDLARYVGLIPGILVVAFIALLPGFMNMFIFINYILDRRPCYSKLHYYPSISVLIACYNEEDSICQTVLSIVNQEYLGRVEIIVIDDGSIDSTVQKLDQCLQSYANLVLIKNSHYGKAYALNTGLKTAKHELIVTVDADSYLMPDALSYMIRRFVSVPDDTVAVAGSVYVRNAKQSFIARLQYWDYFFGIATIKRVQSLMQGTLVAQGAFSLYRKTFLREVGGWSETIGEDIVLTWNLLKRRYRVAHAVDALVFTNVPVTYKAFFMQRSRWARGMFEAFRKHPGILLTLRLSTFVIYWNLLFPILDLVFLFIFLPGLIAALFGYFHIVGPMMLALLPLILLYNGAYFFKQRYLFKRHKIKINNDFLGMCVYALAYNLFMVPACIHGYISELVGAHKSWGTK